MKQATKTYRITKEEVVAALMTENLRPGQWYKDGYELTPDDEDCPACAVGAILRNTDCCVGLANSEIASDVCSNNFGHDDTAKAWNVFNRNPSGNNFLAVLSAEFERIGFDLGVESETLFDDETGGFVDKTKAQMTADLEQCRMHALSIVEAHCPKVLEFEVHIDTLIDQMTETEKEKLLTQALVG